MVPLYPYSGFNFWSYIDTKLTFLNSARGSLLLIAQEYNKAVFLIPSYTCPTVWYALKKAGVDYDFIDIDDTLDFDKDDLNKMLTKYNSNQIVLVPTSLFGAKIKDYKTLYPSLIIIEDRAQNVIDVSSNADFQIVSFGKGKMISGFYGGAVYDKYNIIDKKLKLLDINNEFLKSYILSIVQKLISRVWFLLEDTRYNPEVGVKSNMYPIIPTLLSTYKRRWILNTMNNVKYKHRIKISNYYLSNIKKEYLFDIQNNIPYLRMPIKKNIIFSGVSKIRDFHETYYMAINKRNKEQNGARFLVDGSYLPTHDLVTLDYAKELVRLINE